MLMPAESCAASPTTSLRLGCGWTFVPISQAEALRNRARAASAISSPAWGPAGGAAVARGLDVLPGARLGGEVALGGGVVCELEPADDVAHGEDAGLGRAVAAVPLDAGIFDLHRGVF